jgi:hypothetical protein
MSYQSSLSSPLDAIESEEERWWLLTVLVLAAIKEF